MLLLSGLLLSSQVMANVLTTNNCPANNNLINVIKTQRSIGGGYFSYQFPLDSTTYMAFCEKGSLCNQTGKWFNGIHTQGKAESIFDFSHAQLLPERSVNNLCVYSVHVKPGLPVSGTRVIGFRAQKPK